MARRKRQLLDDSDSDSPSENDFGDTSFDVNDPDAREERALFEDPYQRKRRRTNGKEDAIYGVFGSDDEDEGAGFSGRKGKGVKRSDWTKAPAFTPGQKVELDKTVEPDESMEVDEEDSSEDDNEDAEGEEDAEDADSSAAPASKAATPNAREEEEREERPKFSGLGIGASKAGLGIGAAKAGLGASKAGLGASKGTSSAFAGFKGGSNTFNLSTVTSTPPQASPADNVHSMPDEMDVDVPTSFGKQSPQQRSFVRDGSTGSGTSTPKPVVLTAHERAHFSKLGGTFGARMLEKMGWQAGTGLGTTGEGIVTPVESKLRPKGMGLAFKGFEEKTAQSKAEARRRGEVVSDDEEVARPKRGKKAKAPQQERSDAWKKPKKVKKKIEHKTYEEIVAEAGQEAQSGIGQIIDATGATVSGILVHRKTLILMDCFQPREVSSLADVSMASWTPTSDPMRLPEIRHNLRLITEACKGDLDGLAREARALEERKKWLQQEDERLRKRVEEEAQSESTSSFLPRDIANISAVIARLQQIHLVVDDIKSQAKQMRSSYEVSLDPFSPNFENLIGLYPKEFDRYDLDEVVIAAIAPTVSVSYQYASVRLLIFCLAPAYVDSVAASR